MSNTVQPKVLIVILNYGTYDLTLKLVDDLRSNLCYDNYSIMVVDNCSPNESAAILDKKSQELGFLFYANNKNSGYAAGNNIGIRYGIDHGFDYSWILNNDVEIRESNILEHMIEIAEKKEEVGCIGPKIYSPQGTNCAPYVKCPSFWGIVLGGAIEKIKRQKYVNVSGRVYRIHGCCMLLKNCVMKVIDCLDERTFLYGEENILAERMLAKGFISYYDSSVGILHNHSSSMKRMTKNKKLFLIRESQKSREIYLKDYRHFSAPKRFICHATYWLVYYLK